MCGIAFLFSPGLTSEQTRDRVDSSLKRMRHRGPDEHGTVVLGAGAIGHVRLSIVGLGDSQQPMAALDKRYHLSFNGEIYNYLELREWLKPSWKFRTHGDTEVLLAGLVVHGASFVEKLEGMFSFVFYDSSTASILAARDRSGKKPFFYSGDEGSFACASELAGLAELIKGKWSESLRATQQFFSYGFALPGETFYEGVRELKAGHILTWSREQGVRTQRYWLSDITPYTGTYEQAALQVREMLEESVRQRLLADVEVGSFLSGGLDSSIISALASQFLGKKLKTFTIGFDHAGYNEAHFAKRVADTIGSEHFEEILSGFSADSLNKLIHNHVGQPFSDSSIMPTSLVSQVAAKQVKVVLSGDGSDELFCGYQRYKGQRLLQLYTYAPQSLRSLIRRIVRSLPESEAHHSRSFLKKAHLFLDMVDNAPLAKDYVAPSFFSPPLAQQLFDFKLPIAALDDDLLTLIGANEDAVRKMLTTDFHVYLPQDIHVKVDRASMANSLEVRSPFMSTELIEFCMSLQVNHTLSWRVNKQLLVDACSDVVPKFVSKRRKQGFAVPMSAWFKTDLGAELERLIEAHEQKIDFIDFEQVRVLLRHHISGKRDYGYQLWLFYTYLSWRKHSPLLEGS